MKALSTSSTMKAYHFEGDMGENVVPGRIQRTSLRREENTATAYRTHRRAR